VVQCILLLSGMCYTYHRQDRVEESVRFLEMYLGVAEQIKDDAAISDASTALGATFNLLVRRFCLTFTNSCFMSN
jgi:hypothetical protein